VDKILKPPHQVRIAVVGKYTELADSYKSIHEALVHGGIANDAGVVIQWIASDRFTDQETAGELLLRSTTWLVAAPAGVQLKPRRISTMKKSCNAIFRSLLKLSNWPKGKIADHSVQAAFAQPRIAEFLDTNVR